MIQIVAVLACLVFLITSVAVRADVSPTAAIDEAVDRQRAIGCLATAIAHEAGYEPPEGQQAVAEVILNRVRHAGYPKSICGVVFSGSHRRTGCQFSFTCDGSLKRRLSEAVTANTQLIAAAALDGLNPSRVPGATHYHADYVSPYWAPSLIRIAKIGAHIFYRGAGARDVKSSARAYSPVAEPLIVRPDGLAPVVAQPGETSQPTTGAATSARSAVAFAPWGLPPGR